ncbi:hypothetical protein ATH84_101726 [Paracoccus versutus]|uniref:Uncharacterized protein n=1 Tax=Paracoccus versutus TaxID=34007 RepID=A0AAQ0KLU4_PARVE|nr:hypothetical protein IT40_07880 [Paracoccus versutus]REG46007.1 hypothetical protein ATH84_101726 [Paracoccus versutus]
METAFPQLEFVLATTGNVQTQVNNVEDLIAQQVDAPVILPLAEPVKAAKARGIFFQHQCDICCASSSDPVPGCRDRNDPNRLLKKDFERATQRKSFWIQLISARK